MLTASCQFANWDHSYLVTLLGRQPLRARLPLLPDTDPVQAAFRRPQAGYVHALQA